MPGPSPNYIATKATTLGNTTISENNDDGLLKGAGAHLDQNEIDEDAKD